MFSEIIFILLLSFILILSFPYFRRIRNLPPGPIPLPIVGNLYNLWLLETPFPHKGFAILAKQYGDLMSFWYGSHYMVVISSFSLMKEILSLPHTTGAHLLFPFVPARAFGRTDLGIVWNAGDTWVQLRRFTMRTLKDFGLMKESYHSVIMEEANHLVKLMSQDEIWDLDLDAIAISALNILWNYVAGFKFPHNDGRLKKAVQHANLVFRALGHRNKYSAFPWMVKIFPKWSGYEQHKRSFEEQQRFIYEMIQTIKERRKDRGNAQAQNFVEVFLDEIEKQQEQDSSSGYNNGKSLFTPEQLNVILQDLFLGGVETTGTFFSWVIPCLAVFPDAQENLHEEIEAVIGQGEAQLKHENRMPYTKAFLLEVLRFTNFDPVPIPRLAEEAVQVEGYIIPKGSGILWNLEPLFQDKSYWNDPENFRPERFLTPDLKSLDNDKSERVAVFGFGRRACPGESLAWNTSFLFITTLVKNLEFGIVPEKVPSLNPRTPDSITLAPERYCVKVKVRS